MYNSVGTGPGHASTDISAMWLFCVGYTVDLWLKERVVYALYQAYVSYVNKCMPPISMPPANTNSNNNNNNNNNDIPYVY